MEIRLNQDPPAPLPGGPRRTRGAGLRTEPW